ncbi:MAG: hypothetical protein KR126chlam3_00396 [Chlamydiae bacterium]|nr:hypothetical protein [Chlamydiota bacterium]
MGSLASSYLTQSQSPDQVQGYRVNTESQGEGVLTNLLNGTLTSTAKQMGKKIPPKVLIAALVTTTAIANGAELTLLAMGKLPLHFAGIINAIGLGIVSKISKNWIYSKKYFKAKKVKKEKTPAVV